MFRSIQGAQYLSHTLRPLTVSCSNLSTHAGLTSTVSRLIWGPKTIPIKPVSKSAIRIFKPNPRRVLSYSELTSMYGDSQKLELSVAEAAAVRVLERVREDARNGSMQNWRSFKISTFINGKVVTLSEAAMKPYMNTLGKFLPRDLVVFYNKESMQPSLETDECKNKAGSPRGSLISLGELICLYEQSEAKGNLVMHEHAEMVANWARDVLGDWKSKGTLHLSSVSGGTIELPFTLNSYAIKEFEKVLGQYFEPDFFTVKKTPDTDNKIDVVLDLSKIPFTWPVIEPKH